MIEIVHNRDNINDKQINEEIVRVKAIVINNKNEVLLGYSYFEYQFLGGHVKINEDLKDALVRELKEETGLVFEKSKMKMVGVRKAYYKDLPQVGKNRKIVIYYYEIFDDRIPDLKNTNYTEEELDGNFKLRYIPVDALEEVLKCNILTCGDSSGIGGEILEFWEGYKGGKDE